MAVIFLQWSCRIKGCSRFTAYVSTCLPQGDDYILYCHPHKQKTPRSDRLREWYLTLLRAAKERGIVAHISNLFDTFFEGGRDHRVPKPSVTHMPYLEGADPVPLHTPHLT